jgi:hypothetical protein
MTKTTVKRGVNKMPRAKTGAEIHRDAMKHNNKGTPQNKKYGSKKRKP